MRMACLSTFSIDDRRVVQDELQARPSFPPAQRSVQETWHRKEGHVAAIFGNDASMVHRRLHAAQGTAAESVQVVAQQTVPYQW